MGFKSFDWFGWCLGFVVSLFLFFLFGFLGSLSGFWLLGSGFCVEYGGIFVFDIVSFYLCFLSGLLLLSLWFVSSSFSFSSMSFLALSFVSSFFCYFCVKGFWFWVFYEFSMLPLLLLLVLDSPYSERYVAAWYLLGYVVFTSLPMLLLVFYLSSMMGTFDLQVWGDLYYLVGGSSIFFVLLSILFITKIPLFPFHTWLPVVHAEASSPVSVCLSGYVMKLGLLGVIRFCYFVLPDFVFNKEYVYVCLFVSLFFFVSACWEMDGKRWLAFLSLSHMVVAAVGFSVCDYDVGFIPMLFCLGHGLSAGVLFMVLWLLYEVSGSRKWGVLKGGLSGGQIFCCIIVPSVCFAASVPPTVQFFSEIVVLCCGSRVSCFLVVLFSVYLFLSGLVPMFMVGSIMSRHMSLGFGVSFFNSFLCGIFFLVFWSLVMFLVF